ncbi:MAG: uracil phosphoribosyltransferase [Acidimicrobiales bacterium]|nr:uracil phosphoribosyltransferase [Acidimicrobiales bacterium]
MPLHLLDHPLAAHRLSRLRDASTESDRFRRLTRELTTMLVYEATRNLRVRPVVVSTPTGRATAVEIGEMPIVVPVLRAGLGMMDAALSLLPESQVGLVGLRRDEETLEPTEYADTVPHELGGRPALVCDPMLATGGSLCHVCDRLLERDVGSITVLSLLAAPEGVARLEEAHPSVDVWVCALDHGLDEDGFIVPGLGDAGDRLYGPR